LVLTLITIDLDNKSRFLHVVILSFIFGSLEVVNCMMSVSFSDPVARCVDRVG
jgi:hypothetical protein